MGLDMYLRGEKFFWGDFDHPENDRMEDGLRVLSYSSYYSNGTYRNIAYVKNEIKSLAEQLRIA